MKLWYDRKSKDPTYFIQLGVRNGKKTTTKNIARIGKHSELLKITDDPLASDMKIEFDPNLVNRFMTYSRILNPDSKLAHIRIFHIIMSNPILIMYISCEPWIL